MIQQLVTELSSALKKNHYKLVTAESCTGGGLSYWLTHVEGSSEWFERGLVTYSNISKEELLGVRAETISSTGAVSEETVLEMAEGALQNSHAQISVAITGIAGPLGGSEEKPVGTVWIACDGVDRKTIAKKYLFKGNREKIREQAIVEALRMLLEFV